MAKAKFFPLLSYHLANFHCILTKYCIYLLCCFDRYLRYLDYEVRYVRNFTDIDDKVTFGQICLQIYVKLTYLFLITNFKTEGAVFIFLNLCCLQDSKGHTWCSGESCLT
jgi:hypothetical protein